MCGITGVVTFTGMIDEKLLHRLTDAIHHRGPDASGYYMDQQGDFGVGFGSRRLSIIDLSTAANMPIPNETNDVWIIYNGEIYNHNTVREDLLAKGHVYRSNSDTETVIHAYEEYGVRCVERFNGMFAFALYDQPHRRVLIARDPMGIKPLYYYWDESTQTLLFSSELKGLLASPQISKTVSPSALSSYLSLGYVPSPYSMVEGVKKLPPGTLMVIENGKLHFEQYWQPQMTHNGHQTTDTQTILAQTRAALEGSVQRQLMSDVPLGVFLSGGVDSTLVTALAQRYHDRPLDTFSIGFADEHGKTDEDSIYNLDMSFARRVSKEIGTNHHEIILNVADGDNIADLLCTSLSYLDEPVWETSFIPLNLMSKLARQHGIIVVLTGDGGDELFAGYPWYIGAQNFERYEKIPLLKLGLPVLSALGGTGELGIKARDLYQKLGSNHLTHYRLTFDIFNDLDKQSLMQPATRAALVADPVNAVVGELMAQANTESLLEKFAVMDLALWVREHFNQRVDRMSMMHSVESRVPIQDLEVVKLALSIPMSAKMPDQQRKFLLRQAFNDVIPQIVLNRAKRPFSTPTEGWLRTLLRSFTLDALSPARVKRAGMLNPETVFKTVQEFMNGNDRLSFKIWTLLNFQLWHEAYMQ